MISDFEKKAVLIALDKLFNDQKYFDICTVDKVAKILGVERVVEYNQTVYNALHALHCVHYSSMGPAMAREVKIKTLEVLGLTAETLHDLAPVMEVEAVVVPAKTSFWGNLLT